MTEHGRVISNSRRRGGVFEESTRDFAGGQKILHIGRLSGLPAEQVIAMPGCVLAVAMMPITITASILYANVTG